MRDDRRIVDILQHVCRDGLRHGFEIALVTTSPAARCFTRMATLERRVPGGLAHLLRRTHHLLETAQRGAARFSHAVRRLLLRALAPRAGGGRGEGPTSDVMTTSRGYRSRFE